MGARDQPYEPVSLGDLRREKMWLHLLCNACGREREVEPSKPPLDAMSDDTVVHLLGKSMVCSGCGVKGNIWSVPEFHAGAERRAFWRRP
jgi:hypothetical protein